MTAYNNYDIVLDECIVTVKGRTCVEYKGARFFLNLMASARCYARRRQFNVIVCNWI
jgi:hypothetical protein